MDFRVTTVPGRPEVAVLATTGDLDASSYLEAIAQAETAYRDGTRVLLLDLSATDFVSSSGLVAIHSIALALQGPRPPDPAAGWATIRSLGFEQGSDARGCLKLVNPKPAVAATLAKVGFSDVFDTYPTVDAALAAL